MVSEKAQEILQVFENNGNNLERFGMKLDKMLEPVLKKASTKKAEVSAMQGNTHQ